MNKKILCRDFLKTSVALSSVNLAATALPQNGSADEYHNARSFLQNLLYTEKEVDDWLAGEDGERIMINYKDVPCRINFFCAYVIKDKLVDMLNPKPFPYQQP